MKILHKIKFVVVALIIVSCDANEFLDIQPANSNTPLSFYTSEKQITEGVNAIYSTNRTINNGQWRFGEFRSDNTSYQRNEADRGGTPTEEIDEFTMNSDNGNISSYWNAWYGGILDCNLVLNNIDNVDFDDEELMNSRKGEALFFRSYFYLNLARSFGDIPFHRLVASSVDDAFSEVFTSRIPVSEVYEEILEDNQEAINYLPASWPNSEVGRATKGAALMLQAKILMTIQRYDEAIPYLRQMEGLGYSILGNYEMVFNPSNKNHAESVFEIQFDYASGQASNFLGQFVPFTSGRDILIFNPASGRAGLNQPTQDIIDLYPADDARAAVNIAYNRGEAFVNKYNYAPLAPGQQDVNFPMFRYADARLMLAECLAQTGSYQAGIDIINNEIRPRTGVAAPVTATSQEDALEKIAVERRLELAFENHRWFDLLRTGKAVETMKAHGEDQMALKPHLTDGLEYENIRTLLAIPFNQVDQYGYAQNPGW
ncbi:SusD-like starch-binding protein associating with outer membrane [Jejuia pallidilutea]|uniref:SusD-like starch-binding protein associating with outer membrane n=1 Tax=Jejuia pallidilutea TaxID=504487 RepID=A0A362X3N0_9FLAO|nr:RagB/SusD family nutrient uptake outer membrane protein [Jejuia pallidilutea]PQV48844.1 SusD-like starch-binding protein associating with outer membrane [Jejuia pallidilutea]